MGEQVSLTVIILTLNEERHIERCLRSAFQVASQVLVVDSFSTDATADIARGLGATVCQHAFTNHAAQFAWALASLPIDTEWAMRVDADEVITPRLAEDIRRRLVNASSDVNGFLVSRTIRFLGELIRHGGFPHWTLRVWRTGEARIERRWMDEHIVLRKGQPERLEGELVDHNLNTITWWTDKHNGYASRGAIDLLVTKYRPYERPTITPGTDEFPHGARHEHSLKERIYARLPLGLRAFAYFLYRMIGQAGILDGIPGLAFHSLQGFWFRYLVDVKVWEVERKMRDENLDCVTAIRAVLGVDLTDDASHL